MRRPFPVQWLTKPFMLFTLIMLLKIYLVKWVIYTGESVWLPLMTDLPAVWAVFCLIEWLGPKRKFAAYLIADVVMTCIYFAVIMYYKYFGVIVTFHALQQAGQVTEVQGSVFSLLHPYFLLIYTDIVLFACLLALNRGFRYWRNALAVREPVRVVMSLLLLSLVAVGAAVWQNRDSMNEVKKSHAMGILPYEMYEIAGGIGTAFTEMTVQAGPPRDVTPQTVARVKGIETPGNPKYWAAAKGKNLIVIQLEALQNFLLGLRIDGAEVTPNLNRLMGETMYFPRFYQMVGQGNTADAEYVVNTSLYVPQHGAASQDFGGLRLPGLPRLLANYGYDTATFHTNDVKFWNRKALYRALGFNRVYDKEFFGDDDRVFFGSSDEVLYRKTNEELLKMSRDGKPIYAQMITMSGHHPFNIPDRKIRFALPQRFQDTLVGDYLEAQNYADYALGVWIEESKRNGIWDSSVVVIYGDHMGLPIYSLGDHERDLMKELNGRKYGPAEMLNIPLLISVPGIGGPQVYEQTGGQADIYPTVANLLGIPIAGRIVFGQDLINHAGNLLPERYYLPSGSFVNEQGIFIPGDGYGDGSFTPFEERPKAASDVSEDQYKRALELLRMSDSYTHSLPKLE